MGSPHNGNGGRILPGLRTGGLAALAAVVALACGTSRAWAQEKLPTAEEVLDKSLEAQGGKAAFEKLRVRVSKGTFEIAAQGIKAPITVYEAAPNKKYTLIEIKDMGKIESGTDGQICWKRSAMMGPRLLEGQERAFALRRATFNVALRWRKLYQKAECAAVQEVDGRPCYKIVLTPEVGSPETVYYDRKTHLRAKMEFVLKSPMGEIPAEVLLTDYKKVDGILVAWKWTYKMAGVEQVITMESVEHNVDVPADRFALPKDVKELVEKAKAEKKEAGGGNQEKEQPKKEAP